MVRTVRWHRAYALAIAGLHADALHDIAAAKKMIAEGKPTPEATVAKSPDWLPLVEAVCRFETDKHEFVPEKTIDDYELAALLATRNAELTKITPFMETSLFDPTKYDPVRKFAAELPHCWRIGEAVHITTNSDLHDADAAAMRSQLAATFYSELDRIEDLPRSVKAIIAEQVKSDDATEAAEYRTLRGTAGGAVRSRRCRQPVGAVVVDACHAAGGHNVCVVPLPGGGQRSAGRGCPCRFAGTLRTDAGPASVS